MSSADAENARMLAHTLGLGVEEAAALLRAEVLITGESDRDSLVQRIAGLLAKTVQSVHTTPAPRDPDVEIVIGAAQAATSASTLRLVLEPSRALLGTRVARPPSGAPPCHPWVELLLAALVAGGAVRLIVGRAFNLPFRDPAVIDFGAVIGADVGVLSERVDLGVAHLAGAGAVGTHFVRALSTFNVTGVLHVIDPDLVDGGNLNRCDFYEHEDVDRPKAEVLATRARPLVPGLRLEPHVSRLQSLRTDGAWLQQLVVAVDSRRARRGLQEEIPCDVFDASTTGIEEVVLHFNSRRTRGACLSCLYHEDPTEGAHEEHVARLLGVERADLRVADGFITADAERRIISRHPQLRERRLRGVAYDSLFKELCGAGTLGRDDGQQVLAPLAFVSALAGTLLAFEFVRRRRRRTVAEPFNEWHVSPWSQPLVSGWRQTPARPSCTFCSRPHFVDTARTLWGTADGRNTT